MNACFLEGKHLFPGVPANFTVRNVTSTSAHFEWAPPVNNAALVQRYKLLLKPFTLGEEPADETDHWQAFPIEGSMHLNVSGLEADQPYTAALWAESSTGPGVSTAIDFSTLQVPSDSNSSEPDMTQCCTMMGVRSECMRFCNIEAFANISTLNAGDSALFYSCLNADFHKVLACAADGRNHSLCCARQGIPQPCHKVCAVSHGFKDIGRDQAMCVSFSAEIVQCLREGWLTIPKAPRSLDVYNITSTSLVLSWRSPSADSPAYTNFLISFWSGADDFEIAMPVATKSVMFEYKIGGLNPRQRYTFRVFAVNDVGRSLASNEVLVVTAPETPPKPLIPVAKWASNMSSCCNHLHLTSACSGACSDVRSLSTSHCPDDIPQLIGCWSTVQQNDSTENSQCCADDGVPSECLPLCSSAAISMTSIPSQCVTALPLIVGCYQKQFGDMPSPPRRFSLVSSNALSAVLRWLPPSRNAETLTSYTVFYFQEPNSSDIQSISNITALAPTTYSTAFDDSEEPVDIRSMINPGMMTFTLGGLHPNSLYRAWVVAVSNNTVVSLPSAEISFSTARVRFLSPFWLYLINVFFT